MDASNKTVEMVEEAPEEWRDIPGFEGSYAASSKGRIRSYRRNSAGTVLRLTPANTNRPVLTSLTFTPMHADGQQRGMTVSRAVCLAFHGLPPHPGMTARHVGDDPLDNSPANVRWGW